MLNNEKIRLMTRVTVYEKGMGVKDEKTAKYFRNDYVFAGMVGSFAAGTIAWGVCAMLYCGYNFEEIFFSVYEDTLGTYLSLALKSYGIFMALFLAATYLVYALRTQAYTLRRHLYEEDLDALLRICDQERMAPVETAGPEELTESMIQAELQMMSQMDAEEAAEVAAFIAETDDLALKAAEKTDEDKTVGPEEAAEDKAAEKADADGNAGRDEAAADENENAGPEDKASEKADVDENTGRDKAAAEKASEETAADENAGPEDKAAERADADRAAEPDKPAEIKTDAGENAGDSSPEK